MTLPKEEGIGLLISLMLLSKLMEGGLVSIEIPRIIYEKVQELGLDIEGFVVYSLN